MSDVILQAGGVTASLGGRLVLDGVGLALQAGRIVSIVGHNGGGKTTLLRALLGHLASTGDIRWLGRPLGETSRRDLAAIAAYLPQSPTFEPGDRVIDVLRLGRIAHAGWLGLDDDRDDGVIEAVASDLGLDDMLARPVDTLSGGQRQRVFLGRALAQRPRALLLDEPATYLDLRHQVDLYTLLRRLADKQQLAVLMASHDLNMTAVHADEAIVLKAGRVIAQGDVRTALTEATLSDAFDVAVRMVGDDARAVFVV